jgi:hypothetical protein
MSKDKQQIFLMYISPLKSTSEQMKTLFDEHACQEVLDRISSLRKDAHRKWGKMSVGQMVWHCQIPLKVAIKNKPTTKKGNLLIRLFFKKSLYNDTPWRKNLPTSPFAKAKEEKDFEMEREQLTTLVREFHQLKDREEWHPHPLFGSLTKEQWGKSAYKHLDHHLTQFGV